MTDPRPLHAADADPFALVDDARRARAREAVRGVARRTPTLDSRRLGERYGGRVVLKAENLQRTGSFKLRGALARLAALGSDAERGVVAGSAGNHAQAVAYAARARGVPCTVVMPISAPVAKVDGCAELGATVERVGDHVLEAVARARELADERGLAFVHPFDDPDIVAGQATVGDELLEQVPDLAQVLVPVGGGGLVSGVALALRRARPEVRIVGVQAASHASLVGGGQGASWAPTIADGIAVKRPGELTSRIVEGLVDDVVAVEEDEIAEAMITTLEHVKLLVEGAGAVATAALETGRVEVVDGATVLLLSGGNVDPGLVAAVARRHETTVGRRLALTAVVDDRPGALARLLTTVGEAGANLLEVDHVRDGVPLHVRQTAVRLVVETRGRAHADAVRDALAVAGYPLRD
ncbi:pyridoxal-phosphate dependent enzyme [Patulibacter brassicae]|uniref:Pyridoxal-phosphate dependent enzyme n=1 Tax=Patulibacter brassicae TaxID=1705717 RepID=A0ABU4VMV3_9ACTN|nr:pyridoxal-phosphate dependent enzyme [Patulibacter brassicae]MDX8153143.1 pyridoxal-phosphate dependent enzyme [Patulibacter brassicae]